MAVLGALQSAALRLVGRKPTLFFASDDTLEMELCDLINEVAQDIAKYRDWQALQRVQTLSGNGTQTVFDLPADYDRMMVADGVQDTQNWLWDYQAFDNLSDFLFNEARGFQAHPGGWVITGGKMKFSPAPTAGQTAVFPYITRNIARAENGAAKAVFDDDLDVFLLPERLLTLGLVWRWRENKKLDASGDQEAFIKALDEFAGKDGGSRVYRYGGRARLPGVHTAWPWQLG